MVYISKCPKNVIGLILIFILHTKTFAQVDSLTTQYIHTLNTRYPLTLVDKANGTKYILDSTRTQITAVSKDGKTLWQTRPIDENKMKDILDYPQFVVVFKLMRDVKDSNREKIFIQTSSKYGAYINKTTGKYTFVGSD